MSLQTVLKSIIEIEGPIPVSTYMALCLHHSEFGYYATQPGLGRDFTTAPELNQAFGELLGLWAVEEWRALGAPDAFNLIEIGPGQGSLMVDALRAARVAPDFLSAMELHLVEASPVLLEQQAQRLAAYRPTHHERLNDVYDRPSIFLANEFLDCLPARQFVKQDGEWRERVVGLSTDGEFQFGIAVDRAPEGLSAAGDEVEIQPGLEDVIAALGARKALFRALFVDYGPAISAPGDTLRAFREGKQVDPLDHPGEADLTVDVDFSRLRSVGEAAGLEVAGPLPQGLFLGALGIEARMHQLIKANPEQADDVHRAIATLVEPNKMGTRFKAICLSSPGLPIPAGF